MVVACISWVIFSFAFAITLAKRGLQKRSLSVSGAVAAFCVGAITMLYGFRFGATLVAFYLSSSQLTKYKGEQKKKLEEDYKEGGQRDWSQVLANSFVATLLCIILWHRGGWVDPCFNARTNPGITALLGAFLGHYACCNGDTWASELGILSTARPRLVTTFQPVPRGTNGGMSLVGTAASAGGGAFVGLCFALIGLLTTAGCRASTVDGRPDTELWLRQLQAVPLGTFAGLFGSAVDSLLGATLQYSGFCNVRHKVVSKPGPSVDHISGTDMLSNSTVNFLSALVTAGAAGLASLYIF